MRTHQVQIDDDVFQFVKAHAEPLVDDFNSALRRLLPLGSAPPKRSSTSNHRTAPAPLAGSLPTFPNGTPVALRHTLEVTHLVRSGAYTRSVATQFVARRDNVFPQTVIYKYCRQLSLTASQFDRLLEEESFSGLRKILKSKFPEFSDVIDKILQ